MPESSQFDVRWLDDLVLPYDRNTKELSDKPRIVAGSNMWITPAGTLAVRPGITELEGSVTGVGRIDRIMAYETIEATPRTYFVASIFNTITGFWFMGYMVAELPYVGFASLGTLRDIDESTRPHEFTVARGLVFIKAFPGAAGDKYGSVIFDATGGAINVRPWGIPSPTVAAIAVNTGSWDASTDNVDVYARWKYAYAWKDLMGHYSNRSLPDVDPTLGQDLASTEAFSGLKPEVTVQGHADTTNFPEIGIFRTTDGGSAFFHLEDIDNTGAGPIVYVDNHRDPTTTDNPKLDIQLTGLGPGLVTNTTPPPVGPSGTIGTTQVAPSSNLAYFARRVWYFIGNRLYFSGQEEIANGVPEASFVAPNGLAGNYYDFRHHGRYVKETREALYVITAHEIHMIRGQDRSNFDPVMIARSIGGAINHNAACTTWSDHVFWLTSNYNVAAVKGMATPEIISRPLGNELRALASDADVEVSMEIFSQENINLLMVLAKNIDDPAATKLFVFDLERGLWFTPWTARVTAMCSGRAHDESFHDSFVVGYLDGADGMAAAIELEAAGDFGTAIDTTVTLNMLMAPAGNHLNALRLPAHHPMLSYVIVESDAASEGFAMRYRLDDINSAETQVTATAPPFITAPASQTTNWYPIQKACRRAQVVIVKEPAAIDTFEIQNIGLVFQSEAGA